MDEQGITKICGKCRKRKPIKTFHKRNSKSGKVYRRRICGKCHGKNIAPSRNKLRQDLRAGTKGNMRAHFVKSDCNIGDKRYGRENDLTLEFVKNELKKPCFYCKDTPKLMTLDRIDNSIGHLMINVNPSCRRCNITRGDMPYEAWLFLVDGMRKALEAGAFGDWNGTNNKLSTKIRK
jgi:hypothetical protein